MKRSTSLEYYLQIAVLVLTGMLFCLPFSVQISVEADTRRKDNEKQNVTNQEVLEPLLYSLPAYFEENQGQFDKNVKYLARGTNGYDLFVTATGAVYVLSSDDQKITRRESEPFVIKSSKVNDKRSSKAVAVYMTLVDADANADKSGLEPLEHRTNYFRGSDESEWRTNIPNFRGVRMAKVYEGIDIVWYGRSNDEPHYDFVVRPEADPSKIEWEIRGARNVELTAEGNLRIETECGEIKQKLPLIYREAEGLRTAVKAGYTVEAIAGGNSVEKNFRVRLALANYDPHNELIIDPIVQSSDLSFSTFLGGSDFDYGFSVKVDSAGHAYVAGQSRSATFPTTPGSFDPTYNQFGYDVFVAKLNATGSSLVYSTFLGGGQDDEARDIAVDSAGNVFITGNVEFDFTPFPTTTGAFDRSHNGTEDVFVSKLNSDGSSLVYSTFLGGLFVDYGTAIAVDPSGNAYVTGYSYYDGGAAFPTTFGSFDPFPNGDHDVFVTKLNATGSALWYSTFIGGSDYDIGQAIAVDASGSAFVTGHTNSDEFPTTNSAFDTTFNINTDVFVTKLSPDGSALTYSTFIGDNGPQEGDGIAVDTAGRAFITGYSFGSGYPTTAGAYDRTNNGHNDAFVSVLDPHGATVEYSTFLGGESEDIGFEIVLGQQGDVFVAGRTRSPNFPTTPGAADTSHNGFGEDGFLTRLNLTNSSLIYSTFLGGGSTDNARSIAIDRSGNAFVTGETGIAANNFPTTVGAFDATHNGETDAFILKLRTNLGTPAKFDHDGDARSDLSVWRVSDSIWYLLRSTAGYTGMAWGVAGDRLAPADYDGDGKTDIAIYRPSEGRWYVVNSQTQSFQTFTWGVAGDLPVPTDRDGDGKADLVVFRPSDNTWYTRFIATGGMDVRNFGVAGDKPVRGDFDADGVGDLAVFRPSDSTWYIQKSAVGFFARAWGQAGDIPVPADYDGDGATDIAIFRPTTGQWWMIRSSSGGAGTFDVVTWGESGDIPVPADYDGDGRSDTVVFRPSNGTWYIIGTATGFRIQPFGQTGDVPTQSSFIY